MTKRERAQKFLADAIRQRQLSANAIALEVEYATAIGDDCLAFSRETYAEARLYSWLRVAIPQEDRDD